MRFTFDPRTHAAGRVEIVNDLRSDQWTLIPLAAITYLGVLWFLFRCVSGSILPLIAVGIALNAAVIALNLGMPYRAPTGHAVASSVKHRPERADDVATILSDRIVIPPLRVSISFGDLIIAVGLVDLCYRGSRRPRGQTRSRAASTRTS